MAGRGVEVDGGKIREIRERASYERRELAELVGIDKHSLYRIEKGMMNTSRPTLRRIALALGVRPEELRQSEETGAAQATKGA